MGRRAARVSALVALLSVVWRAHALAAESEAAARSRPPLLDEVVVTATRLEQPLGEATADVTVLTRTDIEQSAAQTVDDLLRQVPGFSLFRRSSSLVANPTTQGVSLRGIGASGASRTLVLVDGIPINDPFGGWVYWSKLSLERIERIEVVRGGTASTWGNYAMGGVINIITKHPTGRSVAFGAAGGTRGTASLEGFGSERWGALGLSLAGDYFRTDGYPVVRADQRGPIDIDADSEHKTFNGTLEYDASPTATVSLQGSYFSEDRGNGTPLTGNDTSAGYVGASAHFTPADGSDWSLTAFSHLQTFRSTFSTQAPDRATEQPSLNQFDVPATDVGASAQWSKAVHPAHVVAAGADFRWIDGETNEDFRFVGTDFTRRRRAGGEQQFIGAYLQDNYAPAAGWLISIGGRVDLWRSLNGSRVEHSLEDGTVTLDESFSDRNRGLFDPSLSTRYDVTDQLSLRGAFYRGFRAPTLNELFRPFRVRNDITEANASLDPERLLGGEVGLDYGTGGLLGRLTGYRNDVTDAIANVTVGSGPGEVFPCAFVPAGGVCRQRQNLDRARIQGVEVDLSYHLLDLWTGSVGYLFSHTDVVSAPNQPSLEGKRLPQVPEHQFVVQLEYANPRLLDVALQVRYVGDQFEDDLNTLTLGSFAVVDLALRHELRPGVEIFFGIENLLDRTYEVGKTADGLVTTGAPLLAHGGVRLRF